MPRILAALVLTLTLALGALLAPAGPGRAASAPDEPAVQVLDYDLGDAAFTEGAFRMVSVRTEKGRLSFSGIAADSPFLGEVLAGVRTDSPGLTATAGLTDTDKADLRDRLVAWRKALPESPDNTEVTDPALKAALRERGYWGTGP